MRRRAPQTPNPGFSNVWWARFFLTAQPRPNPVPGQNPTTNQPRRNAAANIALRGTSNRAASSAKVVGGAGTRSKPAIGATAHRQTPTQIPNRGRKKFQGNKIGKMANAAAANVTNAKPIAVTVIKARVEPNAMRLPESGRAKLNSPIANAGRNEIAVKSVARIGMADRNVPLALPKRQQKGDPSDPPRIRHRCLSLRQAQAVVSYQDRKRPHQPVMRLRKAASEPPTIPGTAKLQPPQATQPVGKIKTQRRR